MKINNITAFVFNEDFANIFVRDNLIDITNNDRNFTVYCLGQFNCRDYPIFHGAKVYIDKYVPNNLFWFQRNGSKRFEILRYEYND